MESRATTVLVVDDEPMIRNLVSWILRRNGYQVLIAHDGAEGLLCFEAHEHIDLVVSDVVMPKLGGVDMVRELRQRCPTLPVLFMSAYTGHDRPTLEDRDLHLLLSKPFTPDQLVDRVQKVLLPAE